MYSVRECPVCSNATFDNFGKVKDYTVSHETFQLVKCKKCDFLLTSPRPEDSHLGAYYLSSEYISHAAKATSLFDKLYGLSRELATRWKLTLVKKFSDAQSPSLLDYGCGTGFFLKKMKQNGFNIAGVEPSPIARTTAEQITGIKIHEDISGTKSEFNIITLWHVLEHVSNLNDLLDQLKNRLKQNGTIIIAVPNHQSEDAKKYGTTWAGYDVPRHLWHFEQKTMTQLLSRHQLELIETIPMKLDALYVSMLSEKYLAGKQSIMTFTKGLISGVRSNLTATNKNYSSLIYIARHQ